MTRKLLFGAMCAAAALTLAAPAAAQDALKAPVGDRTLDQIRGGYMVVDGLTFDFGAEVRSFIDGKLALETRLTLDQHGTILDTGQSTG